MFVASLILSVAFSAPAVAHEGCGRPHGPGGFHCHSPAAGRPELEAIVDHFSALGFEFVASPLHERDYVPYLQLRSGERFPLDSVFFRALRSALRAAPSSDTPPGSDTPEVELPMPWRAIEGTKNFFIRQAHNFGVVSPQSTSALFRANLVHQRVGAVWAGLYVFLEVVETVFTPAHFLCNALQAGVLYGESVNFICEATFRRGLRSANWRSRWRESLTHVWWQNGYGKGTFKSTIDGLRGFLRMESRFLTTFSTVYFEDSALSVTQNPRLYRQLLGEMQFSRLRQRLLRSEFSPFWFAVWEERESPQLSTTGSATSTTLDDWLERVMDPSTAPSIRHMAIYEMEIFFDTYLNLTQDLWAISPRAGFGRGGWDPVTQASLKLHNATQLLRKTLQYWLFEDPESHLARSGVHHDQARAALRRLWDLSQALARFVLEHKERQSEDWVGSALTEQARALASEAEGVLGYMRRLRRDPRGVINLPPRSLGRECLTLFH